VTYVDWNLGKKHSIDVVAKNHKGGVTESGRKKVQGGGVGALTRHRTRAFREM